MMNLHFVFCLGDALMPDSSHTHIYIYVGTKGHPLTLSGAQKLPRAEAPPHGVGLPSTSLAIDIDAPIVACQAAGADLSSPKVGIDVLFFWGVRKSSNSVVIS